MVIQEETGVHGRALQAVEDVAGAAQFDQQVARGFQAREKAEATWSALPATTGVPSARPVSSAACRVTCAHNLGWPVDRAQPFPIYGAQREQRIVPVFPVEVK